GNYGVHLVGAAGTNPIRGNTIAGAYYGVSATGSIDVDQNTITGAIYGVYIGSDATGKVRNNSINNQVVPPSGPPEVNPRFGINVASADIAIYANNVSWNLTGIEAATDEIYGNNVHHNTVGIKGSGLIGGSSWAAGQPNDIHDNDTGVEAAGATTVLFNR